MTTITAYTPREVHEMMADKSAVLIDVREPHEVAAERIEGAVSFPLSSFDPAKLPDAGEQEIIFHCAAGVRSARAVEICAAADLDTAHMTGGIAAWKQAGLPTQK